MTFQSLDPRHHHGFAFSDEIIRQFFAKVKMMIDQKRLHAIISPQAHAKLDHILGKAQRMLNENTVEEANADTGDREFR